MHADQPLSDAEWLTRSEEIAYLNPNFATICSNMDLYPASSSSPLVTSVLPGLNPSTSSASSSLPMQTSTYFISPVITFCAFSLDHSFLRKLRSTETVTPCFLAAFNACSVSLAALSLTAGVIPVKWNQSAPSKIASKSKSFSVAVVMEECALS